MWRYNSSIFSPCVNAYLDMSGILYHLGWTNWDNTKKSDSTGWQTLLSASDSRVEWLDSRASCTHDFEKPLVRPASCEWSAPIILTIDKRSTWSTLTWDAPCVVCYLHCCHAEVWKRQDCQIKRSKPVQQSASASVYGKYDVFSESQDERQPTCLLLACFTKVRSAVGCMRCKSRVST